MSVPMSIEMVLTVPIPMSKSIFKLSIYNMSHYGIISPFHAIMNLLSY